jgi:hypothetical protein
MHLYWCDFDMGATAEGVGAQLPISNTQWRCPQAREVLTPAPCATRLRVVQAARPTTNGLYPISLNCR